MWIIARKSCRNFFFLHFSLNKVSFFFLFFVFFVLYFQTFYYGKWHNFPTEHSLRTEHELQIWSEWVLSSSILFSSIHLDWKLFSFKCEFPWKLIFLSHEKKRNCDINGWMVHLTLSPELWYDELLLDTCSDKSRKQQVHTVGGQHGNEVTSNGWRALQGDVQRQNEKVIVENKFIH